MIGLGITDKTSVIRLITDIWDEQSYDNII